jgi:hypothetical protein
MICKSGAQTQDGGNCSSIQDLNLWTTRIQIEFSIHPLMMLKDSLLEYSITIRESTKDGELSTLIKLARLRQRV